MTDGTEQKGERGAAERVRCGIAAYVPATHLEYVKQAMFKAGAGCLGAYDCCAWQISGQGQFWPLSGSQPFLGTQGALETVEEVRVEMIFESAVVQEVVAALKHSHPYEQPAYWIVRLEDL